MRCRRRGRVGGCRAAPVLLGAAAPRGSEELAEVGWAQCWASSVRNTSWVNKYRFNI